MEVAVLGAYSMGMLVAVQTVVIVVELKAETAAYRGMVAVAYNIATSLSKLSF